MAGKALSEPLVRISHECDIHYAEEVPNGYGGTELRMTSKILKASAIVPASVAVELAKELADDIAYESSNPCLSYDYLNADCRGWINTLESLKEEYKDLQDKEPDYEVEVYSDDWYNDLIGWALQYTKNNGMLSDYAEIASNALAEVNEDTYEELLEAGYSPSEVFEVFSEYIAEDDILFHMCFLRERYPKVDEFLKEMEYNCDEE